MNQINIQQLSDVVHGQVFPGQSTSLPEVPPELIELSQTHLQHHDLYGKTSDSTPPIGFDLPKLIGDSKTLDEHFYWLGLAVARPYIQLAGDFARGSIPQAPYTEPLPLEHEIANSAEIRSAEGDAISTEHHTGTKSTGSKNKIPRAPAATEWVLDRAGWTRYVEGQAPEPVESPGDEEVLVFDVETLYKQSPFAIMACAASPNAWYSWLSPWLLELEGFSDRQLIPLGDPTKPRVIIGHNVGYDRARIKEEYDLTRTRNVFLDTMSFHVAVNGMCSRQRPAWLKNRKTMELRSKMSAETDSEILREILEKTSEFEETELWMERSSINSLKDVAEFHCGRTIDKAVRDYFGELDRKGVRDMLPRLLNYCASDVSVTFEVYQKVLDGFFQVCPHPVSFGALLRLSSVILPVNQKWEEYIRFAEDKYIQLSNAIQEKLLRLVEGLITKTQEDIKGNPWLEQLDWKVEPFRFIKKLKPKPKKPTPKKGQKKPEVKKPKTDAEKYDLIPAHQKLPGKPQWYRDLVKRKGAPPTITVRTRAAAFILELSWDGYPLIWSDKHGWTFRVPVEKEAEYLDFEKNAVKCIFSEEDKPAALKEDKDHVYFKLPHKDGPNARCVNPLSKNYLTSFENGRLTSGLEFAREALVMNAMCSYWISSRERIMQQMMVYKDEISKMGTQQKTTPEKVPLAPTTENFELDAELDSTKPEKGNVEENRVGFILPQLIPMGTITRRAVEKTWLTASNAKKNRVGSELKSMVTAPPGYHFVGADVEYVSLLTLEICLA